VHGFSVQELLEVWERGQAQPAVRRALVLLSIACPEAADQDLEELSVGQRDARLLELRERTFGSQLSGLVTCPGCDERLEAPLGVADVFPSAEAEEVEPLSLVVSGYAVSFRLPNSSDLAAVQGLKDVAEIRHSLLCRCLQSVVRDHEQIAVENLPAPVVDAITDRMEEADPHANVQLAFSCQQCGHQWLALFDILSFFWSEIDAWAVRTLREVHTLARYYGWHEKDILAMSPWRRECYLNMVTTWVRHSRGMLSVVGNLLLRCRRRHLRRGHLILNRLSFLRGPNWHAHEPLP
jgi:hypothetical protein